MKSSTVNMVVQKKHHILYGWGHLNSPLSRQKSSTPPPSLPTQAIKKLPVPYYQCYRECYREPAVIRLHCTIEDHKS